MKGVNLMVLKDMFALPLNSLLNGNIDQGKSKVCSVLHIEFHFIETRPKLGGGRRKMSWLNSKFWWHDMERVDMIIVRMSGCFYYISLLGNLLTSKLTFLCIRFLVSRYWVSCRVFSPLLHVLSSNILANWSWPLFTINSP